MTLNFSSKLCDTGQFTLTVARRNNDSVKILGREKQKKKIRLPILLSFIFCTIWQRYGEGAFRLFRERHKLGPHRLKLCQLVIQLMHSRCCILIALPDGWWIGVSPPIQNKPLGTKKYKRHPHRKRNALENWVGETLHRCSCADAYFRCSFS